MKPIKIAIYGLVIVAAVALFCYMHSDRAKIVRLFESAAKIATREPGESVMEGAVKAKALAALLRWKGPYYTRLIRDIGTMPKCGWVKMVRSPSADPRPKGNAGAGQN